MGTQGGMTQEGLISLGKGFIRNWEFAFELKRESFEDKKFDEIIHEGWLASWQLKSDQWDVLRMWLNALFY